MRKLFIGGINKDETTDEKLADCFSQFGEIVDHVVMKDKQTGLSRGFGFVTFAESASLEKALQGGEIRLDGRKVDLKRAMPREMNSSSAHEKTTRLFVGGVSHTTEEELQAYIENRHPKDFGSIIKIDFLKKPDGSNKGFGFIDCSSTEFADRLCISEKNFSLNGRSGEIKKAEPREARGGNRGDNRSGNRGGGGGYSQGGYGGNQGNYGGGYSNQQGGYNNKQGNYGNNSGGYGNNSGGYGNNSGGYGNNSGNYGNSQGGYGGNSGYGGQQSGGGYHQSYQQQSGGYNPSGYGQSSY